MSVTAPAQDTSITPQQIKRGQMIDGLRALADFLDSNPHLEAPGRWNPEKLQIFLQRSEEAPAEQMRDWAVAATGLPRNKDYSNDYAALEVEFSPNVVARVVTFRANVCERVVVGTETITETVPDPAQVAQIPTVEVTRTVEHVEWVCSPLLAGDVA